MAASRSEIKKRLLQFPEDFLVLEKEGTKEIVAFSFSIRTDLHKLITRSVNWKEMASTKTPEYFNPDGDCLYGISLTARSPHETGNLSYAAIHMEKMLAFAEKSQLSFLCGSRIGDFYKWAHLFPVDDYIHLHIDNKGLYRGVSKKMVELPTHYFKEIIQHTRHIEFLKKALPLDMHLRFFFSIKPGPPCILKVVPNYFKDKESLNYGVLLLWA